MVINRGIFNPLCFDGRYLKSLIFFLFLPCTSMLQAQELLRGQIFVDSLRDSSIHIINITQQTGTVNSASGYFEILVNRNDTLWFTSVHYEKAEVVINESILQKKFVEVRLKEAVIELGEVNISNITLSGNLNADIRLLETSALRFPKLNAGEINKNKFHTDIPSSSVYPQNLAFEQNKISEGEEIFDLKIDLNLIGDLFKKKHKNSEGNYFAIIDNLKNQFGVDFFERTLGIEGGDIMNFVVYLNEKVEDPLILHASKSLALTELLLSHSFVYKARRTSG